MVPAEGRRRGGGFVLATALALAAICEFGDRPSSFFSAVRPRVAWPRARRSLTARLHEICARSTSGQVSEDVVTLEAGDEVSPLFPFEQLKVGDKHNGTVTAICSFGAFVDVGCDKTGLLHISHIPASDDDIKKVSDCLEVGQEIDCWIGEIDEDKEEFRLTMIEGKYERGRFPRGDVGPFLNLDSQVWHQGEVTSCARNGLFVRVTLKSGHTCEGLVKLQDIREGFVTNSKREASVGENVMVRVLGANRKQRKLYLTMRKHVGRDYFGDVGAFERIDESEWLTGKVLKVEKGRAHIEVTEPLSQASATGTLRLLDLHPPRPLWKGKELRVRVSSVNVTTAKMTLTTHRPFTSEEGVPAGGDTRSVA